MFDKIKKWINQKICVHDWRLFAQGENIYKGIRYGIYECIKCGLNTHPHDKETIFRKNEVGSAQRSG